MRDVIVNWFPLLKRLTRLQILGLKYRAGLYDYFTPSLDDLEEERKACEELRTEGCPNIAKVCFNPDIVWNFYQDLGLWKREEWPKDKPLWSLKYE